MFNIFFINEHKNSARLATCRSFILASSLTRIRVYAVAVERNEDERTVLPQRIALDARTDGPSP